jgi:hypothetical protein
MTPDTILGYHANILWRDGSREVTWFTVEERLDIVGDPRIATAAYTPLTPNADRAAVAWLVEGGATGPYVSDDSRHVRSMIEQGATITSLVFNDADVQLSEHSGYQG